ncbi:reverse transcriptase domain-containing protein [Tanacetum coccineum]
MADNRTMAQMLQAPIEGYEDAIVTSTFRHPEVPNTSIKLLLFPFSLEGEARTWLDKEPPRSILTWDDLVSKFINQFFPPSKTTYLRNEITTFLQKPNETFNEAWERFKGLLRQCPHPCFSNYIQLDTWRHLAFNQPNVQNNQGNQSRYQGNNFNSNQNRGNNFNQNHQNNQGQVYQPPTNQPPVYQVPPYQAPTPQIQGVSKTDFENYVKANDAVLKNVQNQGQNLQNQMANVTSLLTSLCNNFKNSASTSNSGTLPSQTVTNPREQINAITTRSGKTCEGPSTPLVPTPVVSTPQKEPEQNPETSMDKVQKPSSESTAQVPPPEEEDSIFIEIPKPKAKKTVNIEIQDLNSPRPNSYQSKLPYPERMKVRENDKPSAQHSRFLKMFKQLRLEIGLKDALVEMPKFNKWLSSLLRNKEKLEDIAITTVNAECSAIIMNKVPEKLEDPGKFLIPCALQELDRFEVFRYRRDIDEIEAVYMLLEVSSNFVEEQNESSITFSLRSDPLHHEFAGEVIALPSRNDHEFGEYLSLMTVLWEISTSRSQEHVHTNQSSVIESLPVSPIPVEDSEPAQEEIDIFLVPDDLIPPGVENDDSKDEDT